MAESAEYERTIARLRRPGLLRLWAQIEAGDTPDWEAGKAFEYLIVRAFELEGADAFYPFDVRLEEQLVEQIDGLLYVEGLAVLVEAKDQADPVNVEPLAKMRNQLMRRPSAAIGAVFSRSGFTAPARTLARYFSPQTVLLWQGEEIGHALREGKMVEGLRAKYRNAVRRGLPEYNLLEEGLR